MVALLCVDALVVPLQVRLADELLGAVGDLAREGVLSLVVVSLHMRLEVVAAAEELPTPLDCALEVCLLLSSVPPRGATLATFDPGPSSSVLWERGGGCGLRRHRLGWQAWLKRGIVTLTVDIAGEEDLRAAAEGLPRARMATWRQRARKRELGGLGHWAECESLA